MQKNVNDSIILIIEDNQTQQNIMQVFLKNNGFNFISAYNGTDAFKILYSILPDLILLDIMLPGMDGFEICSKLKDNSRTKDIPIIFITALRNENDIIKGLKLGASDYLGKPFNQDELVARVSTHLNLKLYRDQILEQNLKLQVEVARHEKSKKDLQLSDEKFRKVFQLNPNPTIIVKYDDLTFWDVNIAFLNFIGISKEDLIGSKFNEILIFNDINKRNNLFEIFDKAGTVHEYNLELKPINKNIKEVLLSMEKIIINDEVYFILVITDITDSNNLKKLLDSNIENIMRVSTLTSDLSFKVHIDENNNFKTIWQLGSFFDLLGYSEQELSINNDIKSFIDKNSNLDINLLILELKAGRTIEKEFFVISKDSFKLWLRLIIEPIINIDSSIEVMGSCKNISEFIDLR